MTTAILMNDALDPSNPAQHESSSAQTAALQASVLELREALEAGDVGHWSLDLASEILTTSATCREHYGRGPDEAFSYAQLVAAVHVDDRERRQAALQASVVGGSDYRIDYRLFTPAGELRWINVRGRTLRDAQGQALRITGISQDITERMAEEGRRQALAQLSDRIRDLADPAELAYAAAEILGRHLEVSRAGYGLVDTFNETITIERDWNAPGIKTLAGVLHFRDYGSYIEPLKRGETIVIADAEKDPMTAATAAALKAISAQAFVNMPVNEEGGMVALLYLNHAEQRVWHPADLALVREVAHRTRMAVERRRAEHRLRALTASLEQQVESRTRALLDTEEALRQAQKMEAVGQLTGGVAHDFNNLLTVIRSSTDLLGRPNLAPERRQRYVEAISETVNRATRLTGQLLAFARRQTLKPEAFDVGASVSAVIGMLNTLVGSRVNIDLQLPDEGCFIHADPSQFDTALINMAVNARDAMAGQGRVTITVAKVDAIPGQHAAKGQFVAVAISDTGAGIDPADLARIFEPFFTTKAFGDGTGLGLSQVFGFARQSGGDVQVHSAPGQGATFTLYLPSVQARTATEAVIGELAQVSGGGVCVLVVEDNEEVGAFAAESLLELGYAPVWVKSAERALVELTSVPGRFDVVFSDVVMPGINGIELATRIGELFPQLPVILTSGYSHVLEESGLAGFELLHKPYSVDQLSRVLGQATKGQRHSSLL
ncbi:ATP-binding protein [Pseudomonas baltica]|uniref:ATP-binding protein n=1 Tax=Pseudomonas baltica TaxID=2762576 RepID=UPI00289F4FB7|nr:ATP-binding protein [Pseudomonas baltica]